MTFLIYLLFATDTVCCARLGVHIQTFNPMFVLIVWVRGDFADHAKHITFLIVLLLVSAYHVPVSLTWYVGVQHLSSGDHAVVSLCFLANQSSCCGCPPVYIQYVL